MKRNSVDLKFCVHYRKFYSIVKVFIEDPLRNDNEIKLDMGYWILRIRILGYFEVDGNIGRPIKLLAISDSLHQCQKYFPRKIRISFDYLFEVPSFNIIWILMR